MDFINIITTWWSSLQTPTASNIGAFGIGILIGLIALLFVFLILAPILTALSDKKQWLIDDPNNPHKVALFANPIPGVTHVKMRNGRVIGYIRGGEKPQYGFILNPWSWYQWYCYQFGLYLIGIPLLQTLYNYELPRLITHPVIENGKKRDVFDPFTDRSNHVRTKMFTFRFVVSGAEVETVPVRVEGSVQARITPRGEYKALFETDQWNVLLTQAVNSVIPGLVKSGVSLNDIIGSVTKGLWDAPVGGTDTNKNVSEAIFRAILAYKVEIDGKPQTLKEIASIEVLSTDITNFILEISDEEEREIRAGVVGRQKGRGIDLAGQGNAAAQKASLDVIKDAGDAGLEVARNRAFVQAAEAGTVDAILAGLMKKLMPQPTNKKE